MIAVVDYGAGNLFSVANALEYLKIPYRVTEDPQELEWADGILLPGVGAFPDAMERLRQKNLVPVLRRLGKEKPFLGVCLGMQVLFEWGEEFSLTEGLGLLPGRVTKLQAQGLKIPHMGWNRLQVVRDCPLTWDLPEEPYVYFVHSYAAVPQQDDLVAWADYGGEVPALVWDGAYCYGAQFHPEKSGGVGLAILRNFADLCRKPAKNDTKNGGDDR
ncbi:MAG: imidazole glycerol phosphate synthase subunit HisH [Oscillospiraceae bacterium]|nr:imidazole glycerol phosphate synthase subunit HisH [Oscillospiraceae bacterium]